MPARIVLHNIGALPDAYGRETQSPQIYHDDKVFLTVRCQNEGDVATDKSFAVRAILTHNGAAVYDESHWLTLGPGEHKDLVWELGNQHLEGGPHHLSTTAFTQEIEGHEHPYHMIEWDFEVSPHGRKDTEYNEQDGEVITAQKTAEQSGWVRAHVTLQLWDYNGTVLNGYQVQLTPENSGEQHQGDMTHGVLEWANVLVHPAGSIHVQCWSNNHGVEPYLQGNFAVPAFDQSNPPPHHNVLVQGWQNWEAESIQATSAHAVARQLTVSGKVSFKIFDSVGAEVGGSYSDTTTDTEGESRTWRAKIATPDLLPQPPAHSAL